MPFSNYALMPWGSDTLLKQIYQSVCVTNVKTGRKTSSFYTITSGHCSFLGLLIGNFKKETWGGQIFQGGLRLVCSSSESEVMTQQYSSFIHPVTSKGLAEKLALPSSHREHRCHWNVGNSKSGSGLIWVLNDQRNQGRLEKQQNIGRRVFHQERNKFPKSELHKFFSWRNKRGRNTFLHFEMNIEKIWI